METNYTFFLRQCFLCPTYISDIGWWSWGGTKRCCCDIYGNWSHWPWFSTHPGTLRPDSFSYWVQSLASWLLEEQDEHNCTKSDCHCQGASRCSCDFSIVYWSYQRNLGALFRFMELKKLYLDPSRPNGPLQSMVYFTRHLWLEKLTPSTWAKSHDH